MALWDGVIFINDSKQSPNQQVARAGESSSKRSSKTDSVKTKATMRAAATPTASQLSASAHATNAGAVHEVDRLNSVDVDNTEIAGAELATGTANFSRFRNRRHFTEATAAGLTATQGRRYSNSDVFFLIFLALCMFLAIAHYHHWFGWFGPNMGGMATGSAREEVRVSFLNVSAGEAILVQSPEGKNLLIDGGPDQAELRTILNRMQVDEIDTVVATHDDTDHISGLFAATALSPQVLIGNSLIANPELGTPLWRRLMNSMQDSGAVMETARDQTVNLGSVEVDIVAPPAGLGGGQNNQSVGVLVRYGKFKALMTGDSENPQTARWMSRGSPQGNRLAGPVQVYQGTPSPVGDREAWLRYINPANVVLHTGINSGYRPPADILQRYKDRSSQIYSTSESGIVTFIGRKNGGYEIKLDSTGNGR